MLLTDIQFDSVLVSATPEQCQNIISGAQSVLVKKSKPKLDTPFKSYIYCTMGGLPKIVYDKSLEPQNIYEKNPNIINGRVIGEFVCDEITEIHHNEALGGYSVGMSHPMCDFFAESTCMDYKELHKYLKGKDGYGWHISDLVIYDKPKELSDFKCECKGNCIDRKSNTKCEKLFVDGFTCSGLKPLTKAPNSWCYVREGT